MNEYLIIISCLLILIQRTRQRRIVSGIYCAFCVLFMFIEPYLSDVMYYVMAGCFDLVFLRLVCMVAAQNTFTDRMLFLPFSSLMLNLYGLVNYDMGLEPDSFLSAFSSLYLMGIYTMLKKDGGDGSIFDYRLDNFRMFYWVRNSFYNWLHYEAKN